jgi:tetratricopeptide (TPR) repeat protein
MQDRFLAAVQAEEAGEKQRAIALYEEILEIDPEYAAAYINLGTINFHLRQFGRAEELYRRATEADPGYVLAFFDLGNVLDELQRLDESIAAYRQAVALGAPLRRRPLQPGAGLRAQRRTPPCAAPLAGLCEGWTTAAPGPTTPAARSASCSAAKSSPSPGAQPLHSAPQGIGGAGTGEQLTSLIRPFSAPDIHR